MTSLSSCYPISALPFTAVRVDDPFWSPRIEINRTVTVPYDFQKCEKTGRISNFAKAAGLESGPHVGLLFNDSDVFKVIEGAAYSLMLHPDPQLDAYIAWQPDLLHGVNVIYARGAGADLTFVPYYAWAHRGVGEMAVWVGR